MVQTLCKPLRLDATGLFLVSSDTDDSGLHQEASCGWVGGWVGGCGLCVYTKVCVCDLVCDVCMRVVCVCKCVCVCVLCFFVSCLFGFPDGRTCATAL
jgi:hypothetical protein